MAGPRHGRDGRKPHCGLAAAAAIFFHVMAVLAVSPGIALAYGANTSPSVPDASGATRAERPAPIVLAETGGDGPAVTPVRPPDLPLIKDAAAAEEARRVLELRRRLQEGQKAPATTPADQERSKLLKEAEDALTKYQDLQAKAETAIDPVWQKYFAAKQREYLFQEQMMEVNVSNFFHQQVASYVIMGLVVLIVLSGLWLAYVQLNAGLASANAATTIDASVKQVKITTSVVGVVVLAISLAFFYIYIYEVYHIRIIDMNRPLVTQPDKKQTAPPAPDATKVSK